MKKVKMLSSEALRLMVTSAEGDNEAVESEGAQDEVLDNIEGSEGNEEVNTEAEDNTDVEDEANAEDETDVDDEAEDKADFEALQTEFDEFKEAAEKAEADAKAALEEAEAKAVETAETAEAISKEVADLKEVVVAQITNMRLVLSLAAVDMSEWDTEAVLTEYNSVKDSFMKSLPTGSVVPEKAEDTQKVVRSKAEANALAAYKF